MKIYYLYLLVFFMIITSCKKKYKLSGIYYNKSKAQIYEFEDEKVKVFDFSDSTFFKKPYEISNNKIIIGKSEFKFKNYNNDSLKVIRKGNEEEELLVHIDFKNIDYKNFAKSEWLKIKDDTLKISFFMRIEPQKGILHFFKDDVDDNAIITSNQNYIGKLFNRFHSFAGTHLSVLVNYNEGQDTINFISFLLPDGKFKKMEYIRINTNVISNDLLGKWEKVDENIIDDRNTIVKFKRGVNKRSENDEVENLSLLTNFSELEFTNDGYMIRGFYKKNKKVLRKTKVSYNQLTGFLFTNDLSYIKDNALIEEQQHFKVLSLSKETLTIRIFTPDSADL